MAIVIPKYTDKWRYKIITILICVVIVYLFFDREYAQCLLGIMTGFVLILNKEVLHRALMINIMDDQLISLSSDLTECRQQIDNMNERISTLETQFDLHF